MDKKIYISIDGVMSKEDQSEITENEYNEFWDKFIELVESYDYAFGGASGHHTEKEMEEIQK